MLDDEAVIGKEEEVFATLVCRQLTGTEII
jgi:hypothetical protein